MRYFGQTPDYWLDHCTLAAWNDIWSRELEETPPADALVAAYLDYKPPERAGTAAAGGEDAEVWECPFADVTE